MSGNRDGNVSGRLAWWGWVVGVVVLAAEGVAEGVDDLALEADVGVEAGGDTDVCVTYQLLDQEEVDAPFPGAGLRSPAVGPGTGSDERGAGSAVRMRAPSARSSDVLPCLPARHADPGAEGERVYPQPPSVTRPHRKFVRLSG